jgi:hypothetical protein
MCPPQDSSFVPLSQTSSRSLATLPKNKIEGFVIDKLKEKVLTDENLSELVGMVNEKFYLLSELAPRRGLEPRT